LDLRPRIAGYCRVLPRNGTWGFLITDGSKKTPLSGVRATFQGRVKLVMTEVSGRLGWFMSVEKPAFTEINQGKSR
jgi:hypothetical protein